MKNNPLHHSKRPYHWKAQRKLSPILSEEESRLADMLEDSYSVIEDIQGYLDKRNSLPKYVSKERIFKELAHILLAKKAKPEKKLEALQLIDVLETKIKTEGEINSAYVILIPAVLSQLGSSSPVAQKASIDILQRVNERRTQILLEQLASNGIDNMDDDISIESLKLVPGIFYKQMGSSDQNNEVLHTLPIIEKSFKQLTIKNRKIPAYDALIRLREFIGDEKFESMVIHGVPEKLKNLFHRLSKSFKDQDHYAIRRRNINRDSFGIIPSHITNSLYNRYNRKVRAEGMEQLKEYLTSISNEELHLMYPYIDSFLRFLGSLMNDPNVRVVMISLEIQQMFLYDKRTAGEVRNHFHVLISNLLKIRPESIPQVNIELYQFLKSMMSSIGPGLVANTLVNELNHKSTSKREEIINYIIYGLLTFPSSEFDLFELSKHIIISVNDSKKRVRQGALECIAVIGQALGPQRSKVIYKNVSELIENPYQSERIIDALQCRFSRKLLPKILEDGSVEYGLQIPRQMYNQRLMIKNKLTNEPDIDWILQGRGALRKNVHSTPPNLKKSLHGIQKSSSTNSLQPPLTKSRAPRRRLIKKKTSSELRSLSENCNQSKRQLLCQSLSSREER
uniref:Family with sequence similarity 179, member B [Heterocephalus glaber] n=1 Tax=Lepeophtheirus salmonis TaxID=72036 RepID=A0A0K2UBY9_LEPSM